MNFICPVDIHVSRVVQLFEFHVTLKTFCGQREKTRPVIIELFMGLNSLVVTRNSRIKRNATNYGNIIAVANNMDRIHKLF